MSSIGRLWGGILREFSVDVAGHRVRVLVYIHNAGQENVIEVMCTGVTEVRVFDPNPAAWDYAEVTAASAREALDGSVVLDITMWTEDAGMAIRCAELSIDGQPLAF